MKSAQEVVNEDFQTQIDPSTLTGHAKELVDDAIGKEFTHCGNDYTVSNTDIYARGHDGGFALENGEKLWLSVKCPECDYHISAQHWDNNLY